MTILLASIAGLAIGFILGQRLRDKTIKEEYAKGKSKGISEGKDMVWTIIHEKKFI